MTDREPKPNDPLGPIYPAELPHDGRTWFALLLLAVILLGAVLSLFALLTL